MSVPAELRYTKDHEWVRPDGPRALVGITDYAQSALGDIVFVEPPKVGADVSRGLEVTTVESVKAASPIYAPVSGKIVEANGALDATPELINQRPYEAFIFVVEMSEPKELDELLSPERYEQLIAPRQ